MVGTPLKILQDVLFWFMNSKLRPEQPDTMNKCENFIEQRRNMYESVVTSDQ